jgi:hypothetical protein
VAKELGTDVTGLLHDQVTTPHNLPSPLTSFVGREKTLIEIKALLDTHRLLTLTGAGGCGESRLALELSSDLIIDNCEHLLRARATSSAPCSPPVRGSRS